MLLTRKSEGSAQPVNPLARAAIPMSARGRLRPRCSYGWHRMQRRTPRRRWIVASRAPRNRPSRASRVPASWW